MPYKQCSTSYSSHLKRETHCYKSGGLFIVSFIKEEKETEYLTHKTHGCIMKVPVLKIPAFRGCYSKIVKSSCVTVL